MCCIGGSSLHLHRVTRCLNSRKSWTSRQFTASRLAMRGRQQHWHFQCFMLHAVTKKNIKTSLLHTSLRKLANPFFLASRYSGANLTHRFSRVSSSLHLTIIRIHWESNRNTELVGRTMVRIEENPWEYIGAHWSWLILHLQHPPKFYTRPSQSISSFLCQLPEANRLSDNRLGRHYRHWCQFLLQNLPRGSWEHNSWPFFFGSNESNEVRFLGQGYPQGLSTNEVR